MNIRAAKDPSRLHANNWSSEYSYFHPMHILYKKNFGNLNLKPQCGKCRRALRLGVCNESLKTVDKACAIERITADPYTDRLA